MSNKFACCLIGMPVVTVKLGWLFVVISEGSDKFCMVIVFCCSSVLDYCCINGCS